MRLSTLSLWSSGKVTCVDSYALKSKYHEA